MDYTKEIKEKLELTEEEVDQDTEEYIIHFLENLEQQYLKEENQDTVFLNTKNCYENITLFVKLAFNNYFSFLKRNGRIKECDVEEFSKSVEFQNQKMRLQNSLKEDLFTSSGDYDFALKFLHLYGWKQMGLFN